MARRSTPALSKAAEGFIAYVYGKGGSEGMRYGYRSLLSRLAAATNDRQVGNLTPEDVETFFYGRKGLSQTCSRATLGKYRNDLGTFLRWCHRRGWCDDPGHLLGGVTHTSTRTQRNRLRLSEGQLWAMVEQAPNPRDAAMLVFAMHTGCRISEIQAVPLRALRLDTGEVALRIIKTHEEDVMRVSPALDGYLREWLTFYHRTESPSAGDLLFPAQRRMQFFKGRMPSWGERGFEPGRRISNPGQIIRRMADGANVPLERGDGWHTVRRSVARIFFDKASHLGYDAALRMTAAFLHHKNTSTTEIYLGLELEKAKRDEIMTDGFLTEPTRGRVVSLTDYREVGNG